MNKLQIPHEAFIFIGDGRKALFLRNAGDEKFPNLIMERVFIDENPATREQGSDRRGRAFKRARTNRRAGMEATDWHELEEQRFARRRTRLSVRVLSASKAAAVSAAARL